ACRLPHSPSCHSFLPPPPSTTEIYTLSLHDALPISGVLYIPSTGHPSSPMTGLRFRSSLVFARWCSLHNRQRFVSSSTPPLTRATMWSDSSPALTFPSFRQSWQRG